LVFHLSEASYLAGMVAGGLSKTGTIGFIGGIELPPIKEAQRAWEAGARAVNPKIVVRETYLNSFDDIAAGREATLALMHVGADMFHHNADAAALGMFQAIKESPTAYAFGANSDQTALAPARVVGSAVIDLPRAFLAVGREVKSGSFTPHVEEFGLKSGVIRYEANPALVALVSPALQAKVDAARDSIVAADHSRAP
jgi:basic membrane lipoprotein Med (substrate-binding protein (PBP1-ABC) superfamily)